MPEDGLVKTGISGLDKVLLGGFLRGNVILVEGGAGTGKTSVGTSFIYHGVTAYNEPGIIVVFESNPDKLIRDAAGFGWDLHELQHKNQLKIVFTSPQVLDQELRSPDSVLLETAAEMGARRIFIDGISLLRSLPYNGNGISSYRELLQELIEGLHRENLTAMLSHEVLLREDQATTLEVAEFLADTVLVLKREPMGETFRRTIEITKSRGQDYDYGKHTMRIGKEGVELFRRVQARPRGEESQPTSTNKRSVIGWEPMDNLIGGGIFDGSTTMVVGTSGSGKTVLGVQLLLEGVLKQGSTGLMVSLDEHPAQILRNAGTLGLDLRQQVEAGTLHLYFESPQELEIDVHYHRIVEMIEKHKVKRLLIDGMTSYSSSIASKILYRDFFHSLVGYTKHNLLVTFFNYETPELFGLTQFMPEYGVSSIVDNIVLLNFVELGNTLHRSITVAKARGSRHEFATREFTIGQGGISFVPPDEGAGIPVLPFQSYYNVLSRAPTRFSPWLGRMPVEDQAPSS